MLSPRFSATNQHLQLGFTLLEILVVIGLVAIMSTFMLPNLAGDPSAKQLEKKARKITAQIELAQNEAMIRSQQIGLKLWQNGYRFWLWNPQTGWQPHEEDQQLQPSSWQQKLALELSIDGQYVDLEPLPAKGFPAPAAVKSSSDTASTPAFEQNLPTLLFFSSSESTVYQLTLRQRDVEWQWKLSGNPIGQITLSRESNPEFL